MFPIFDTNLWFSSIHCEPTHQSLCPLPSKKWKQLRTIEVTIPQGFSKLWLSLAGSFLLFYFLLHPGRWPHSTLWYCNKSVHKDAFWQLYYRCPLILSQIWDVQKRWICGVKLLRNLISHHGVYTWIIIYILSVETTSRLRACTALLPARLRALIGANLISTTNHFTRLTKK